ncbi:DNA polymerase III subunit delta' [Pseudoalteromonas fenneropenaei]|uniref:DNA-directed DNA polymerase n=1 Tax=Pseudoalteromonas fenneropenaei TaxID=1737459 RepID=A0ABV7CF18_9GAMM
MLAPWLEAIRTQLANAHGQGRLHHAIMLTGLRGVGKRALATQLANALLCQNPQQLSACGNCKSCGLLSAATHPDKLLLAEDNASIGVDAVREISHFVTQSAQQGGNKVAVIERAQNMTDAAANALLKTLEEPNSKRYLLLTCDEISRLPATILSRCLKVDVAANQGALWLASQSQTLPSHPWLSHFDSQPYLVLDWQDAQVLPQIDTIFQHTMALTAMPLSELQTILTKNPELVDTLCVFVQAKLRQRALAGVSFQQLNAAEQALLLFTRATKQQQGGNLVLQLTKLFSALKQVL